MEVPPGLPPGLQALTAPCYLHRAPPALVAGVVGLVLLVVLAGLAALGRLWMARSLSAPETGMALFLLVFLVVLLRPSVWRAPVVMAADRQGLFFVGGRDSLLVPWSDTGPLTIERARVGEGVADSVVVAIAHHSAYWGDVGKARRWRQRPGRDGPPGYGRAPLGTQGIDPARTLASLQTLRRMAGLPDSHPDYQPGPLRRSWDLVVAGAFFLLLSLLLLFAMLRPVLSGPQGGSGWVLIPLLMAVFSGWVLRYGWRRRH